MIDMIEGMLRYPLTETVNNMVACDQIRFEIDGDLTISAIRSEISCVERSHIKFFTFARRFTLKQMESIRLTQMRLIILRHQKGTI